MPLGLGDQSGASVTFVAAPTGVTATDTAAVQAAIDATGGGVAWLQAGTYLVETLTMHSDVELRGVGAATVLKLAPGTNGAVIETEDFVTLTAGNTQGGPQGWSVRHLIIDADKANNGTTGYGIRAYGYGFTIEDVNIRNAKTNGIYSQWSDSAGTVTPDNCEARVRDLKVHGCDGDGIYWNGPHDTQWSNVVVYDNGVDGIHAGPKGTANQFTNVHVWGTAHTGWCFNLESTGNQLTNCEGEGAATGQVFIGANDNAISGGHFFGAGVSGSYGIQVGDGSHTNIAGSKIDTKISSCTAGALNFGSDSHSQVVAKVYQVSGAAIAGTPSSDTALDVSVAGGATGPRTVIQGDLVLRQTAPARMGQATLTAGKVQVFTASITASSYVFVTRITPSGTLGHLVVENVGGTDRAAGSWFFVSSVDSAGAVETSDTSEINWLLIEPV